MIRADDDSVLLERGAVAIPLKIAAGMGVKNNGGQVEFFLKLQGPLFPQRGRGDDEQLAATFRPRLAEDETGFDGFAKADFIGEQDAFGERRPQREHGGLDLVGIEFDSCVK